MLIRSQRLFQGQTLPECTIVIYQSFLRSILARTARAYSQRIGSHTLDSRFYWKLRVA